MEGVFSETSWGFKVMMKSGRIPHNKHTLTFLFPYALWFLPLCHIKLLNFSLIKCISQWCPSFCYANYYKILGYLNSVSLIIVAIVVQSLFNSLYPTLWIHGLQHTRLLCPPLSARVCSNSCSLSRWCYPTISSSATPFFYLQSFPESGSFLMSQLAKVL